MESQKRRGRPPKEMIECQSCGTKVPKSKFVKAGSCCWGCWVQVSPENREELRKAASVNHTSATEIAAATARAEVDSALARIQAEQRLIAHVEAEMKKWRQENPACACCGPWGSMGKELIEDEHGNLWCALCAYTVLRTGACSFHGNVIHYPEVAKHRAPIPVSEIPAELLPK